MIDLLAHIPPRNDMCAVDGQKECEASFLVLLCLLDGSKWEKVPAFLKKQ